MKYCPYCGKEIETDAQFCAFCGKKLNTPASSEPCENAGDGAQKIHQKTLLPQLKALIKTQRPFEKQFQTKIIEGIVAAAVGIVILQLGLGFAQKGMLYKHTLNELVKYYVSISQEQDINEKSMKCLSTELVETGVHHYLAKGLIQYDINTMLGENTVKSYYICSLECNGSLYGKKPYYESTLKDDCYPELYRYREQKSYKERSIVQRSLEKLFGIRIMYIDYQDSETEQDQEIEDIVNSRQMDLADYQDISCSDLYSMRNNSNSVNIDHSSQSRAFKMVGVATGVRYSDTGIIVDLDCSPFESDTSSWEYTDENLNAMFPADSPAYEQAFQITEGDVVVCYGFWDGRYLYSNTLNYCANIVLYLEIDEGEYYTDEQISSMPSLSGSAELIAYMLAHNLDAAQQNNDSEAYSRYATQLDDLMAKLGSQSSDNNAYAGSAARDITDYISTGMRGDYSAFQELAADFGLEEVPEAESVYQNAEETLFAYLDTDGSGWTIYIEDTPELMACGVSCGMSAADASQIVGQNGAEYGDASTTNFSVYYGNYRINYSFDEYSAMIYEICVYEHLMG